MSTQHYNAQVHVRTRRGELVTIYHDFSGPVGMPDAEVRAIAGRAALAEVCGGRIEGFQVSTDGEPCKAPGRCPYC